MKDRISATPWQLFTTSKEWKNIFTKTRPNLQVSLILILAAVHSVFVNRHNTSTFFGGKVQPSLGSNLYSALPMQSQLIYFTSLKYSGKHKQ